MSSVIEKLGISKSPWKIEGLKEADWGVGRYESSIVNSDNEEIIDDGSAGGEYSGQDRKLEDLQLIATAPEMLERDITFFNQLIKIVLHYHQNGSDKEYEVA